MLGLPRRTFYRGSGSTGFSRHRHPPSGADPHTAITLVSQLSTQALSVELNVPMTGIGAPHACGRPVFV